MWHITKSPGKNGVRLSIVVAFVVLLGTVMTTAAQQPDTVLLGIITAPNLTGDSGLKVLEVLERSPAQEARILVGDILEKVGKKQTRTPQDLEAALRRSRVGQSVDLHVIRDGARLQLQAQLMSQMSGRGSVLRGRNRGTTGFQAPGWFAYAWANLAEGQQPPTPANTQGKVVVIHCFQSW